MSQAQMQNKTREFYPEGRYNCNRRKSRLLHLIAPRPQCFLLREQSIIDTGRP